MIGTTQDRHNRKSAAASRAGGNKIFPMHYTPHHAQSGLAHVGILHGREYALEGQNLSVADSGVSVCELVFWSGMNFNSTIFAAY